MAAASLVALSLLVSGTASATESCPKVGEPPLSQIGPQLVPGARIATGAFDTVGDSENPLAAFRTAFRDQLTVGGRPLEVRGFVRANSGEGRAVVLFSVASDSGLCVVNAWQSAEERFTRLSLISMWRAKDGQRSLFLVEASSDRRGLDARTPASRSVVFSSDGSRVSIAFESTLPGLAFDPQPDTVALLGAGDPLFFDAETNRMSPRPIVNRGSATGEGTCPATGNKPLKLARGEPGYHRLAASGWLADDSVARLYDDWPTDPDATVAFRKLLMVDEHPVEVVAVGGSDALLVFLSPQAKGVCVLNVASWSWGGNGTSFASTSWWRAKNRKRAVLLTEVSFAYHHGVSPDDPRSEEASLAVTIDGLVVRKATSAEQTAARSETRKKRP